MDNNFINYVDFVSCHLRKTSLFLYFTLSPQTPVAEAPNQFTDLKKDSLQLRAGFWRDAC
jgi:hypothetical protein